jgi:hypothetical protein
MRALLPADGSRLDEGRRGRAGTHHQAACKRRPAAGLAAQRCEEVDFTVDIVEREPKGFLGVLKGNHRPHPVARISRHDIEEQ